MKLRNIHIDPYKNLNSNFSGIIFLTIPGPFPTIPDHNTVRLTDNQLM